MSKTLFNRTNTFLICCTCLAACTSNYGFPFFGFPINGIYSDMGEPFPLSEETRLNLSIVWYIFLLAISATILLYIAKAFKKDRFYKAYQIFWWYGAFVFTIVLFVLKGIIYGIIEPQPIAIIVFVIIYSATLFITIVPAYLQHRWTNPPNKTEVK